MSSSPWLESTEQRKREASVPATSVRTEKFCPDCQIQIGNESRLPSGSGVSGAHKLGRFSSEEIPEALAHDREDGGLQVKCEG